MLSKRRAGARDLGHTLHDLGHRRFAVLAGPADLLTAAERVDGFREAVAHRGGRLAPEHVVPGPFTRDGGYAAMQRLLDEEPDVSCVFAVNDVMAVGAMAALRDRGVDLPAGMAVAGFDDIATLRDVSPALTTVRIPLEEIGALAVRLALDEGADRPRLRRVAGEVVVRASTPRLPA